MTLWRWDHDSELDFPHAWTLTMTLDPNNPKDLQRFIDGYLKALRGDATFKDSAWIIRDSDDGFKLAERPSPEMRSFVRFHEDRLTALLLRSTLFVYWQEGDTEATVQIMPVIDDHAHRKLTKQEQQLLNRPFERIKLPFPPKTWPLMLVPPSA
jgi:hypothetical protein